MKGRSTPMAAAKPRTATSNGRRSPRGAPITPTPTRRRAPRPGPFNGSGANQVSATLTGLTQGTRYHYRLVSNNATGTANNTFARTADATFRPQDPPGVVDQFASAVNTDNLDLNADVEPRGGETTYQIEWGTDETYGNSLPAQSAKVKAILGTERVTQHLSGLTPGADLSLSLRVHEPGGNDPGPGPRSSRRSRGPRGSIPAPTRTSASRRVRRSCSTVAPTSSSPPPTRVGMTSSPTSSRARNRRKRSRARPTGSCTPCTGARSRASPATRRTTGTTHTSQPGARMDGPRGTWGFPPNGMPSDLPFGSPLLGADLNLSTFAFGENGDGTPICDPCFDDGSVNVPLRDGDAPIAKGMAGSLNPAADPAVGAVREPVSGDGTHLIFGTTAKFESDGNSNGDVTIYDRNLLTGATHVVSKTPGGATMTGTGIAELAVSERRIARPHRPARLHRPDDRQPVLAPLHERRRRRQQHRPDAELARRRPLRRDDGRRIQGLLQRRIRRPERVRHERRPLPRRRRRLERHPDPGLDRHRRQRATPTPAAPSSHWNNAAGADNCDVVAFAGGAGVAAGDGTVFFLSPEELDGSGTAGEPNLFVARPGSAPHFVATLDPGNPAIHDAVYNNEVHSYGDFQVTPSGRFAAFATVAPVTEFTTFGHSEIYRYDADADALDLRLLPAHPGASDHRYVPHAARAQPQRRRPRLLHLVGAAGAAGHEQPGRRLRVGERHRRADLDRLQRGRLRHRHRQRRREQRLLLHPPDAGSRRT